ncbi:MAG: MerR family transcriptional regulator, partial [Abditibacteriota bacterium]|nr:MerR family transcriptional regulator [Abditibacteriota bacterium]
MILNFKISLLGGNYEKIGLVVPVRVGSKNRMYSQNDIKRLKRIQEYTQQMGVNLAGVEVILDL